MCLRSGVSAGQVEQVERLAGTAEKDFQAPPAGPTTLQHMQEAGSKCLLHHYMGKATLKQFTVSHCVILFEQHIFGTQYQVI